MLKFLNLRKKNNFKNKKFLVRKMRNFKVIFNKKKLIKFYYKLRYKVNLSEIHKWRPKGNKKRVWLIKSFIKNYLQERGYKNIIILKKSIEQVLFFRRVLHLWKWKLRKWRLSSKVIYKLLKQKKKISYNLNKFKNVIFRNLVLREYNRKYKYLKVFISFLAERIKIKDLKFLRKSRLLIRIKRKQLSKFLEYREYYKNYFKWNLPLINVKKSGERKVIALKALKRKLIFKRNIFFKHIKLSKLKIFNVKENIFWGKIKWLGYKIYKKFKKNKILKQLYKLKNELVIPELIIYQTANNIYLNFYRRKNILLFNMSMGQSDLINSKKHSLFAIEVVLKKLIDKIYKRRFKILKIIIQTKLSKKIKILLKSFLKILDKEKKPNLKIWFQQRFIVSHNGLRKKKKRRL